MLQKIALKYAKIQKGMAYCVNPGVFNNWFYVEFKVHSFCNYYCPNCCGNALHDKESYEKAIAGIGERAEYTASFLRQMKKAFPYRSVEITLIGGETMIGIEHFLKHIHLFKGVADVIRVFTNGSAKYEDYLTFVKACKDNFIAPQIIFSYHESQLKTTAQRLNFFKKYTRFANCVECATACTVTIDKNNVNTPLIITQLNQCLNSSFPLDFKDLYLIDGDGLRVKPSLESPHLLSPTFVESPASSIGRASKSINKVNLNIKEIMDHNLKCTGWYNGMVVYEDGKVSASSYCPMFTSSIKEDPSKIVDQMKKHIWVDCKKEQRGTMVCPLCVGGTVQIND